MVHRIVPCMLVYRMLVAAYRSSNAAVAVAVAAVLVQSYQTMVRGEVCKTSSDSPHNVSSSVRPPPLIIGTLTLSQTTHIPLLPIAAAATATKMNFSGANGFADNNHSGYANGDCNGGRSATAAAPAAAAAAMTAFPHHYRLIPPPNLAVSSPPAPLPCTGPIQTGAATYQFQPYPVTTRAFCPAPVVPVETTFPARAAALPSATSTRPLGESDRVEVNFNKAHQNGPQQQEGGMLGVPTAAAAPPPPPPAQHHTTHAPTGAILTPETGDSNATSYSSPGGGTVGVVGGGRHEITRNERSVAMGSCSENMTSPVLNGFRTQAPLANGHTTDATVASRYITTQNGNGGNGPSPLVQNNWPPSIQTVNTTRSGFVQHNDANSGGMTATALPPVQVHQPFPQPMFQSCPPPPQAQAAAPVTTTAVAPPDVGQPGKNNGTMYPSVGLTNNGSHSSPGGFNQQHALNCNVQTVPTASTAGQFNPIIQNGHHHHHHHHHPLQQVQQVQPAAVQAVPHMTITQPSACISFPAQSTLPGGISSPVVTHQMPPGCTAATPAGLHPAGTPAYQLGSPIQQPLALTTLTITQPPFIRSGQPVQSTITLGSNGHHLSVSPSSNGHHPPPPLQHQHRSSSNSRAAESAPASSTTPNSTHQHSSHSNQQTNLVDVCSVSDTEDSQRHRRRIGGFNFDDMNTLWTTPQSNAKQNKVPMSNGNSTAKETAPKRTATSSSSPIAGRRGNKSSSVGARTPTTPPSSTTTATSQSDSTHQYRFPFNKQNPPARDFDSSSTPSGQLTITVKAGEEEEAQLSRMCTVHPRTRDIRIRRLERLPSHRRHFRCETCTDILNDFVSEHGFYPTDNQKKDLLRNVGMTPTMLSYWFSNRRRTSPVGLTSLTRKTR